MNPVVPKSLIMYGPEGTGGLASSSNLLVCHTTLVMFCSIFSIYVLCIQMLATFMYVMDLNQFPKSALIYLLANLHVIYILTACELSILVFFSIKAPLCCYYPLTSIETVALERKYGFPIKVLTITVYKCKRTIFSFYKQDP